MQHIKAPQKHLIICYLAFFLFGINLAMSQNLKQEKMNNLSFMVGDWIGTSTTYKNETIDKQVPAFQTIRYDLDKHLIVINLHSETLQLHTIIYFDEEENMYSYNPFSKNGKRKLPAEFKDGKFIVNASKTKRFVFSQPSEGHFQEYGETFENGRWTRYFEDNFKKTQ